jgi:hypothetical protein
MSDLIAEPLQFTISQRLIEQPHGLGAGASRRALCKKLV